MQPAENNRTQLPAQPRDLPSRVAAIAIAFAIALAVLSLGIAAPFEKDVEPQSAQWVVDIADHGHWLLPHDYYDLVERKPPLFYWLGAIGVKLSHGRIDEVHARLPSLVAGAALSALVMDWAAAGLGTAGGWLAFFFLLGMYGFAARAVVALTDMLMTLFLFAEWRVLRPQLEGATSWRRVVAAGLILGLGILVKGPVIVVLVGLATIVYRLMIRENPLRLAVRAWPWAWIAVALAVAAAWYVPAFNAGRANDWGGVFIDENFGHFLPATMGGTGEAARPFYFILMRLLGGTLPLCLLIPALMLAFAQGLFPPVTHRAMLFQLAMVLAVLLLFSASSAKRDDYILPAIPPLAILFAALFCGVAAAPTDRTESRAITGSRLPRATIVRDLTTVTIGVAMLLGTAVAFLFARAGGSWDALPLQSSDATFASIFLSGISHMRPPFAAFAAAIVSGATITASGFARRASLRLAAGLATLCLAGTMLWTGTLKPQLAQTRSLGPFTVAVKQRVGTASLYLAFMDPEFAWYYGRGVRPLPRATAMTGPARGAIVYFVARPNELARLAPAVRNALILVLPSNVLGGNPPALYLMGPAATEPPRLNTPAPSVK